MVRNQIRIYALLILTPLNQSFICMSENANFDNKALRDVATEAIALLHATAEDGDVHPAVVAAVVKLSELAEQWDEKGE